MHTEKCGIQSLSEGHISQISCVQECMLIFQDGDCQNMCWLYAYTVLAREAGHIWSVGWITQCHPSIVTYFFFMYVECDYMHHTQKFLTE